MNKHIPEYPKKINFGIHEKSCNLSCPKCLMHSEDYPRGRELRKTLGRMSIKDIVKVFDEVKHIKPMVSPSFWSEPLLNERLFKKFVEEAKKRDIPVMVNTNALLIDEEMAKFLIDNLHTISISIDATTKETLLKARSTDELEKIENAVMLLLRIRGDNLIPRIVVSFTEEDFNIHEKEEFISHWINEVDAIRVNKAYDDEKQVIHIGEDPDRIPCRDIYDSMTIDFDGTARACCIDAYRETNLGNVFKEGVSSVWKGKEISDLRNEHESNKYSEKSFCKDCDQWAGFNIVNEYEEKGLLIRETRYSTYYNRIDRLGGWSKETRRIDK